MTTLKSLLNALAFVCILCFSINAQAQYEKTNSAQIAGNQSEYSIDELELDDIKAKTLKSVNDSYIDRMKQLMKKGSGASREDVEALKRSHNLKIRSILSVEEYEKYLLLQAKKRKEKEAASEKSMKPEQK